MHKHGRNVLQLCAAGKMTLYKTEILLKHGMDANVQVEFATNFYTLQRLDDLI